MRRGSGSSLTPASGGRSLWRARRDDIPALSGSTAPRRARAGHGRGRAVARPRASCSAGARCRLWDPGYRVTRRSRGRLARGAALRCVGPRRGRRRRRPGPGALAALLFDQSRPMAERCLRRLAVAGARAAQLDTAGARALARRAGVAGAPRGRARSPRRFGPRREALLLGAWLCGGRGRAARIEWFLARGRGTRPLSSGDDVVAAGVPRGPRVAPGAGRSCAT